MIGRGRGWSGDQLGCCCKRGKVRIWRDETRTWEEINLCIFKLQYNPARFPGSLNSISIRYICSSSVASQTETT